MEKMETALQAEVLRLLENCVEVGKWTDVNLPAKMLVLDQYQRDLKPSHAKSIARDFNQLAFDATPINISLRNGKLFILDGQHRVEVIRKRLEAGETNQMVRCFVTKTNSKAEEAELFLLLNKSKPVQGGEKFRARYVGGDEASEKIVELIRSAGYEPQWSGRNSYNGNTIISMTNLVGVTPDLLEKSLRIIRKACRDPEYGCTAVAVRSGVLLAAIAEVLRRQSHSETWIINRLKRCNFHMFATLKAVTNQRHVPTVASWIMNGR